jgi:pimeloyl-ACP methyl ester carboxylesterase
MPKVFKIAEPSGEKRANAVFFHGLGGDAHGTWRAGSDEASFWPAWLAKEIEGLSVYSVGYEAPISRWRGSAMHLTDQAISVPARLLAEPGLAQGPPLVLIGHSLGGLVIKQLLRMAEVFPNHDAPDFLRRVKKTIFLATPHTGAGLATWSDRLRILVRPSSATISLVRNDPHLRNLNTWYRYWAAKRNIDHLVLYETIPLRVLGMTVEPGDADPGLSNAEVVPVYADHFTICKPRSREDDIYVLVRAFIKRGPIAEPIADAEVFPKPIADVDAIPKQVKKCFELLKEIKAANARIIDRGHTGGTWARILTNTYNHVCHTCYLWRQRKVPPDPYFDTICAEPDIKTVCDKKWELGEALDDYRNLVERTSPWPLAHHDLELKIRRSVTQPDWQPQDLQKVVGEAIEAAEGILR